MPSAKKSTNKAAHVTTGSIFDDLGLSTNEATEAKIKAELWRDLVTHIETFGYSQKELAKRLEIHQPDVSHLLTGKLSRFSVETFIKYAIRLGLGVEAHFTKPGSAPTAAKPKRSRKMTQATASSKSLATT
ncbi:MAG: helix-turn-helix transcriptional regulator [Acidobacteriaceae bacterium]|nr:helix-turn-helix transcriptional regulator [Acidobacteriaceae bacterium]